jgi:hypothetical protein
MLDAPEFSNHCRSQDHVLLRLVAAGNVVEISPKVPIAGSAPVRRPCPGTFA